MYDIKIWLYFSWLIKSNSHLVLYKNLTQIGSSFHQKQFNRASKSEVTFSVYCYQQHYIWLYRSSFGTSKFYIVQFFVYERNQGGYAFHSETRAIQLYSGYFVLYYTLTVIYTADLDVVWSCSTGGEGFRNNFPIEQAFCFIPTDHCAPRTMTMATGSDLWTGSFAAQQCWW